MSQITERFEAAIEILVGDGPIKGRLGKAYTRFLEDLQQVDLPVPGKARLEELHAALHSAPPVGNIGSVTASIHKLSPAEAWWHARTIVRVYAELLALQREVRAEAAPEHDTRSRAESRSDEAERQPPRFLASGG